MKRITYILAFLLAILGCSKKEVNGEVFVVTEGAGNIKLGLVTVYFLTEDQFKDALDTSSAQYLSVINSSNTEDSLFIYETYMGFYKRYVDMANDYKRMVREYGSHEIEGKAAEMQLEAEKNKQIANSFVRFTTHPILNAAFVQHFIENSKSEVLSIKTNSDGKFSVTLRSNKYWVFANSTRKVMDSDETYLWLFEYSVDEKPLYLSNDNMAHEQFYSRGIRSRLARLFSTSQ